MPAAASYSASAPAPIGVQSTIVWSASGICCTGTHTPAVNMVGKNTTLPSAVATLVEPDTAITQRR